MDGIGDNSNRYSLNDNKPVMRGADLMKEAEGMPAETFDFGGGVVVERRGAVVKMVGSAQMSMRATMAAYEAMRMGGKAGQAIFDTYRKTHPEQFGAAAAARDKAMAEGRFELPPSEPPPTPAGTRVTVKDGDKYEAKGSQGVNLTGGRNVHATGSAAADFFAVLRNATIYGLGGDDRIEAEENATLDGGDGDDVLSAFKNSTLFGGAGNDVLSAHKRSVLDGGDGDDILSAYEDSTLTGGSGNDRIDAYGNAVVDSGSGDDRVSVYDNARIADAAGDNDIQAGFASRVFTGAGNDRIRASDGSVVEAGDGYNMVSTGKDSTVTAGSGDDMLTAGDDSMVVSGAGDDLVTVGRGSELTAGSGDDRVIVHGDATIHFNRGDGNDSIGGSRFGEAYRATDHLSSSTLSFGAGIVPADLSMRRQGNDLLIQIGADSVTLKDVERHGIPTMTFTDGSVLRGDQVAAMVGPAEPYQPASQVLQRFCDASAAYGNQLRTTGTPV